MTEISTRTELLITIYQIIEESSKNRIDQKQVDRLYQEFREKSVRLKENLQTRFNELRTALNIQEKTCEAILKKNLAHIEQGIRQMRQVPASLFEEADAWSAQAKTKLDQFEEHIHDEMFINYDMLEAKDDDIITVGEAMMNEMDKHKDVSYPKVEAQIGQLQLRFDPKVNAMINSVVTCQKVDGVQIDEAELKSLADMIREAGSVEFKKQLKQQQSVEGGKVSRDSMIMLQGDENDLLSESPLFEKAEKAESPGAAVTGFAEGEDLIDDVNLDLINDIEVYVKAAMQNNETSIEMSDTPIKCYGAQAVSAAVPYLESLKEILMSNCEIKDAGAKFLFDELQHSKSVTYVNLDANLLTDKCFQSLTRLLQVNTVIQRIDLKGVKVQSKFGLSKLRDFGDRVCI